MKKVLGIRGGLVVALPHLTEAHVIDLCAAPPGRTPHPGMCFVRNSQRHDELEPRIFRLDLARELVALDRSHGHIRGKRTLDGDEHGARGQRDAGGLDDAR